MKLMDKIRDVVYDSIDYIFMIVIVLVVVGVIGWRLDVLFAKDVADSQTPGQTIVDNSGRNEETADVEEEPSDSSTEDDLGQPEDQPSGEDSTEDQDQTEEEADSPSSPVVVKVDIPVGSMPGKIGLILEEEGLVNSSREFIAKAVELGLDTKLKSGTYNIQRGLPTEDVVRLLTN